MRKNETTGQLNDIAYRTLRDLIVQVKIAPGAALSEDELSKELGVGFTPIRTAIRRLAFERLVSVYPRRGTFAADINIGDEFWLTEIRLELEGLAAQQAAERATENEKSGLVALAEAIQNATSNAEVTDLDASFHRKIFHLVRNPFLEPTLHLYFNLSLRIWFYCNQKFSLSDQRGREQRTIAQAIWEGDGKAARAAIQSHLTNSSTIIRTILSAGQQNNFARR